MQTGRPQRDESQEYSRRWHSFATPSTALPAIRSHGLVTYTLSFSFERSESSIRMRKVLVAPPPLPRCALNRMQHDNSPDPSLDFLSSQFSAEKALVTSPSEIQLPCPEVQPCDNLQQYASVVRGTWRKPPPLQSAACSRGQLQEQPREQRMRAAVPLSSRQRLFRTVKSVISTMESK